MILLTLLAIECALASRTLAAKLEAEEQVRQMRRSQLPTLPAGG